MERVIHQPVKSEQARIQIKKISQVNPNLVNRSQVNPTSQNKNHQVMNMMKIVPAAGNYTRKDIIDGVINKTLFRY